MKSCLAAILCLGVATPIFAHGEDKYGPHGGYVRMPGGFHTELKLEQNELLVYLLDINFKSPTIKNSSIKVDYVVGSQRQALECIAKKTNFACALPSNFKKNQGKVVVLSMREGVKGGNAEYSLPLTLGIPNSGHEGHH